jgi:phosphatidylglycerophosphatase A
MSTSERRWSASVLVATAGGIGFLRPGPGTWASVATALAAWAILAATTWPSQLIFAVAAAIAFVAGLCVCGAAARRFSCADPAQIVIDEVAGVFVALACVPSATCRAMPVATLLIALIAFRIFDIGKPWPLGRIEQWHGALGVMADDIAAGVLAGLITTAVLH